MHGVLEIREGSGNMNCRLNNRTNTGEMDLGEGNYDRKLINTTSARRLYDMVFYESISR